MGNVGDIVGDLQNEVQGLAISETDQPMETTPAISEPEDILASIAGVIGPISEEEKRRVAESVILPSVSSGVAESVTLPRVAESVILQSVSSGVTENGVAEGEVIVPNLDGLIVLSETGTVAEGGAEQASTTPMIVDDDSSEPEILESVSITEAGQNWIASRFGVESNCTSSGVPPEVFEEMKRQKESLSSKKNKKKKQYNPNRQLQLDDLVSPLDEDES